jgi:hypothetical protein
MSLVISYALFPKSATQESAPTPCRRPPLHPDRRGVPWFCLLLLAWLALGVMVEQLELHEKENVEVVTVD